MLFRNSMFDALLICAEGDPVPTLKMLYPYLASSGNFAVFSSYIQVNIINQRLILAFSRCISRNVGVRVRNRIRLK